jgi:hypothetical protein
MANRIFVASYTQSVQTLAFDASASTLTTQSTVEVGDHPSWLEFHPSDRSLVFAGLEETEGKVVAVKYDESGHGTVVAVASSGGADPCSLVATENRLFVANVRVVSDAINVDIDVLLVFVRQPLHPPNHVRHSAIFPTRLSCNAIVWFRSKPRASEELPCASGGST